MRPPNDSNATAPSRGPAGIGDNLVTHAEFTSRRKAKRAAQRRAVTRDDGFLTLDELAAIAPMAIAQWKAMLTPHLEVDNSARATKHRTTGVSK